MRIENRKAFFDYEVLQKWEAGIVLQGGEVKSVKKGAMSLNGARVVPMADGLYLVGAQINKYEFSGEAEYDPIRSRKLLLTKKEEVEIRVKMGQKGLTVVPLSCYTKHGLIKAEIALARGKKAHEKREVEKKRDIDREISRIMKGAKYG